MKSFITNNDIPIGYVTPPFPSLYWPINNHKYNTSYLYDTLDIWKFSIYWSIILNECFYGIAGFVAVGALLCGSGTGSVFTGPSKSKAIVRSGAVHGKRFGGVWMILLIYLFCGAVQGMVAGTIMGYLIAALYQAGLFEMSTWIPFCCGVVQILFDVCCSFPVTTLTL